MKLELQTTAKQLMKLLSRVAGAIRKSSATPILSNVKIASHGDDLTMTGCNLELEITATETIDRIEGRIDTTVDAKKLHSILSTLPDDEVVTLSNGKGDSIELKAAGGRFKLATLASSDYPTLAAFKDKTPSTTVQVKEDELKGLLERVKFAMGKADVRYYLNAMYFKIEGDELTAVATNGHHLAMDTLKLQTPVTDMREVILPRNTVIDFEGQLTSATDLVTLEFDDSCMRASFRCVTYVSKLTEGKFPDYRLVPRPVCTGAQVNREGLQLAAKRVQILAGDANKSGVRMSVTPDMAGGQMRLEARNTEDEEAEATIVFETAGVEQVEFGFNVSYLIDALGSVEDINVKLAVPANGGASMLTVPGLPRFQYLIMPMRT